MDAVSPSVDRWERIPGVGRILADIGIFVGVVRSRPDPAWAGTVSAPVGRLQPCSGVVVSVGRDADSGVAGRLCVGCGGTLIVAAGVWRGEFAPPDRLSVTRRGVGTVRH